jgi:hypothetical protein
MVLVGYLTAPTVLRLHKVDGRIRYEERLVERKLSGEIELLPENVPSTSSFPHISI